MRTYGTAGLAAVLAVLLFGAAATAGTATASFTVRINFVPSMKQAMQAAEIKVRQPDGSYLPLTGQQRERYLEDASSIVMTLRANGDNDVLVRIEF
jgi:hypothetical protein